MSRVPLDPSQYPKNFVNHFPNSGSRKMIIIPGEPKTNKAQVHQAIGLQKLSKLIRTNILCKMLSSSLFLRPINTIKVTNNNRGDSLIKQSNQLLLQNFSFPMVSASVNTSQKPSKFIRFCDCNSNLLGNRWKTSILAAPKFLTNLGSPKHKKLNLMGSDGEFDLNSSQQALSL